VTAQPDTSIDALHWPEWIAMAREPAVRGRPDEGSKTLPAGPSRDQIRSRAALDGTDSVPASPFRDQKRPAKRHERSGFSDHAACHGLTRVAVSRVFG